MSQYLAIHKKFGAIMFGEYSEYIYKYWNITKKGQIWRCFLNYYSCSPFVAISDLYICWSDDYRETDYDPVHSVGLLEQRKGYCVVAVR